QASGRRLRAASRTGDRPRALQQDHHRLVAARKADCRRPRRLEPFDQKVLCAHGAARERARRRTGLQHHEIGFALDALDLVEHGSLRSLDSYSPTRRNGAGISKMTPGGAYWIPPRRVRGRALAVSNRPAGVMYSSRTCMPMTRPNTTLLDVSPARSG